VHAVRVSAELATDESDDPDGGKPAPRNAPPTGSNIDAWQLLERPSTARSVTSAASGGLPVNERAKSTSTALRRLQPLDADYLPTMSKPTALSPTRSPATIPTPPRPPA